MNNKALIKGVLIIVALGLLIGLYKAILLVGIIKMILMLAVVFGAGWFYGKYSK
jgi:hypothetical protein